jgi:hypothetical protein
MDLPEILTLSDVGEVLAPLGAAMDRTNVALALRAYPVDGVERPKTRALPWRIPRAKLVEVVASCLLRRASPTAGCSARTTRSSTPRICCWTSRI